MHNKVKYAVNLKMIKGGAIWCECTDNCLGSIFRQELSCSTGQFTQKMRKECIIAKRIMWK